LALTHATKENDAVAIRCAGETGICSFGWNGEVRFEPRHGSGREYSHSEYAFPGAPHLTSVLDFFRAIRQPETAPITTLQNTRAYLQATNGALQSSGGAPEFDAEIISKIEDESGGVFTVAGLDEQFAAFAEGETAPPDLLSPGDWIEAENIAPDLVA
jgi:hypothetical protein